MQEVHKVHLAVLEVKVKVDKVKVPKDLVEPKDKVVKDLVEHKGNVAKQVKHRCCSSSSSRCWQAKHIGGKRRSRKAWNIVI